MSMKILPKTPEEVYEAQIWQSVKTSSAVEGIRKPFEQTSEQLAAMHAEFVKRWKIAADDLKRQSS